MADNSSLVSVIIPFLNPGFWLNEAVESVIHQTYTNWQLILVDDGSEQDDSATAKCYSKKYQDKIVYVEHEHHANNGLTISRNTGIKYSTGEYVAFLDADDCWLPDKLEKQLEILKQHPEVDMLCEASCFWYSWKNIHDENFIQPIGAHPNIYQPPQLMKLLYPLGEGQPPCPSGIIIKRKTLLDLKAFEERFSGIYQLYEDQAFLSKVYANAVVYVSGDANNMYRKRHGSMSSAANNKALYKKVRLFYLSWLKEYFFSKPNTHPDLKKLIYDFEDKLANTD